LGEDEILSRNRKFFKAGRRSHHNQDADLKQELSGQLDKAGRRGAHYLSEIGTTDVAIDGGRAIKLRKVEDFERLPAEL
jgi:hypothetical protein